MTARPFWPAARRMPDFQGLSKEQEQRKGGAVSLGLDRVGPMAEREGDAPGVFVARQSGEVDKRGDGSGRGLRGQEDVELGVEAAEGGRLRATRGQLVRTQAEA